MCRSLPLFLRTLPHVSILEHYSQRGHVDLRSLTNDSFSLRADPYGGAES